MAGPQHVQQASARRRTSRGSRGSRSGTPGPLSSIVEWPISPGAPARPWNTSPPITRPPPDAVRGVDVDDVLPATRGPEPDLGERAEVGVVVDVDRQPEPLAEHLGDGGAVPARAACRARRSARCARRRARARRPRARAPPTGLASTESTISVSRSAARSSPWSARWSGGSGMRCSATIRCATSESATRSDRVPKCMPATSPRLRARVTCWARRPERDVGAVCRTPALVSSLTMFDTVAGDSPVTPASSTCVREPRCWTALTIRARLASRSEVWEPGVTRSLPTREGYTRVLSRPDASDIAGPPRAAVRPTRAARQPCHLRLDAVNSPRGRDGRGRRAGSTCRLRWMKRQITIWRRMRSFLDFKGRCAAEM